MELMMQLTYLVTIEVERDSGMFASRDDISEILSEEIQSSAESASLSGLGPRSDSEYSVSDASVEEMDSKAIRQAWRDNERYVAGQKLSDDAASKEIKRLSTELKKSEERGKSFQRDIQRLLQKQEQEATRIYQTDSSHLGQSSPRTYLKDGEYDRVHFSYGDDWDHEFQIHIDSDGHLVIRNTSFDYEMAVAPQSSNEIKIVRIER
jgi:hypothetical protein